MSILKAIENSLNIGVQMSVIWLWHQETAKTNRARIQKENFVDHRVEASIAKGYIKKRINEKEKLAGGRYQSPHDNLHSSSYLPSWAASRIAYRTYLDEMRHKSQKNFPKKVTRNAGCAYTRITYYTVIIVG